MEKMKYYHVSYSFTIRYTSKTDMRETPIRFGSNCVATDRLIPSLIAHEVRKRLSEASGAEAVVTLLAWNELTEEEYKAHCDFVVSLAKGSPDQGEKKEKAKAVTPSKSSKKVQKKKK